MTYMIHKKTDRVLVYEEHLGVGKLVETIQKAYPKGSCISEISYMKLTFILLS